ncbi:4a-hydroxytetrahydrobiopterin dehydratase [Candidatus Uhrbacteria bacterium]|nr:4a-hydroxytetrahydrobiopterin dehydratase [Candidatus Uhrbacteria bacterium]
MGMLSNEEIQNKLKNFPGWELDTPFLRKEFTFPTFTDAMVFVNEVAQAAEDMNHHPDINIHHNVVKLSTTTVSQMGVTDKDIEIVRRAHDSEKMIFKDLSKE